LTVCFSNEEAMIPDDILSYVRAMPFRPFRIVLNSGRTYDIRHPELIRVGRSTCIVFFVGNERDVFERWESVSLLLMERIEHLESPATA